jgi:hypothetical protein
MRQYVGQTVRRISRVFFTYQGTVSRESGPLEMWFTDGATLLLRGGGDGETLVASRSPWCDPFGEILSEENQTWIARHGRWSVFDVSGDPPYSGFVGVAVTSIQILRTDVGTICGARLEFGRKVLDFAVTADEEYVFFERNDIRLAEMKAYVGEKV